MAARCLASKQISSGVNAGAIWHGKKCELENRMLVHGDNVHDKRQGHLLRRYMPGYTGLNRQLTEVLIFSEGQLAASVRQELIEL